MKKLVTAMLGIAAVCAFSVTTAQAAMINVRPVPVFPGPETPLQTVFQNIGSTVNVSTEQEIWAYFTHAAGGGSSAQMIIELAGQAATNEYGLYKKGAPGTTVKVFDGTDGAGTQVGINFFLNGDVQVIDWTHGPTLDAPVANFGNEFGFYLKLAGGQFLYSEDALNGGAAKALVFAGNGDNLSIPGGGNDLNHFYLAWEDTLSQGDRDYNDGVFIIESITPVPEPGLIGLLGMGFFAVATSLRRRRA